MSPKFSILEKLQNIRKVTSAWKKQASKKAPWGGGGGNQIDRYSIWFFNSSKSS